MKDNLVNGWYKCIKMNSDWTKGKFYYFENGFTKDDEGRCRPLHGSSPQKYNDAPSELWFELAGLVPADEKEVQKMKHGTMDDYWVNGFYKATKTNAAWSEGKQYYFRDGYTVDDDGDTRPCGEPLKYWTSRTRDWMKKEGLIPATDEMDIFDRVEQAAVNCVDDQVECVEECPYRRTPNCKDQMISDFRALREMRKNRKEQEREAMPIQGGFAYGNKRKSDKPIPVMIGNYVRDKVRFEVFKVIDASIRWKDHELLGIQIKLKGIDTGVKMLVKYKDAYDFFEDFDQWRIDEDGGSFNFVVLEDLLPPESFTQLFEKKHLYSVVEGRVCDTICDLRFRNYAELEKFFDRYRRASSKPNERIVVEVFFY